MKVGTAPMVVNSSQLELHGVASRKNIRISPNKKGADVVAKMTDEELDKALDTITDQTSKAMLKALLDALDRIGKLELNNYDSVAVNKVQQDLDERLIEIKCSFNEQVKKLIRQIEK